jgi:hypothetical protein
MIKMYIQRSLLMLAMLGSFLALGLAQNNILFIGADAELNPAGRPCDSYINDSLTSWGYNVTYMGEGAYGTAENVYDGIDGVIFSESVNSSAIARFGATDNFPVNFVSMEPGSLFDPARWDLSNGTGGIAVHAGGVPEPNGDDRIMVVVDNEHYVTNEYNVGDEIQWSNHDTYYVIGYPHGFKHETSILTGPIITSFNGGAPANTPMVVGVIEDYSWAVKGGIFSLTHQLLNDEAGTPEFYHILQRLCRYVYIGDPTNTEDIAFMEGTGMKVYPNPASGRVRIQFITEESMDAELRVIDITGKEVAQIYKGRTNPGNNTHFLFASNYAPGLYLIQLRTDNKTTYSKVIIK